VAKRGSALVEFTLAGLPAIFMLISTFEMARGMWVYHGLAHAAKTGARFAVVRGRGCGQQGNACATTVSGVARRIEHAAVGLPPDRFDVALDSGAGTVNCRPLSACFGDPTPWPPAGANAPGMDVRVSASHRFRSAMVLFWPGAGTARIGVITLAAEARQRIEF
jgi:hypothetical protein